MLGHSALSAAPLSAIADEFDGLFANAPNLVLRGSTASIFQPDISIVNIDGDNIVERGQQNVLIQLGADMPTTVDSWSATLAGVELDAVSWNTNQTATVNIPQAIPLSNDATLIIDFEEQPPQTSSLIISDFEDATMPTGFNDGSQDYPLWYYDNNLVPIIPNGSTALVTDDSLFGSKSLRIRAEGDGTNAYAFQSLFYNNFGVGGSNDWRYLRETAGYTDLLKYNRIRFWMKPPADHVNRPDGWNNLHFGTYLRTTTTPTTQNESDNGHYYHYFNAGHSGGWQQFIIDPHPHHQRNNNTEHGVKEDGFFETGYNYFDSMTWFYWESQFQINQTADWLIDRIELLEVTEDEDLYNVYAMNAYKSEINTDEIVVRWSRARPEHSTTYDVKYSFSSFYENGGWTHGTAAPGGTGITSINPGAGNEGFTACLWSTDAIDLTGQDVIYIAIKHETETTRFRQIAIPLTPAGYTIVGGS